MPDITIPDWTKLGSTIRAERRRSGLSQSELAALAGTSRSWLARIEAGHRGAELEQILRVLAALGLHMILRSGNPNSAIHGFTATPAESPAETSWRQPTDEVMAPPSTAAGYATLDADSPDEAAELRAASNAQAPADARTSALAGADTRASARGATRSDLLTADRAQSAATTAARAEAAFAEALQRTHGQLASSRQAAWNSAALAQPDSACADFV